jgi:CBS domain-containing protein
MPHGHRQTTIDKIQPSRRANVRVKDFMTSRVVTITPDTTLLAAARLMLEHRVGSLPVLDVSGRIVGIFSESDLLREEGKAQDLAAICAVWSCASRLKLPTKRHS